jgi:hypothetical protein
LAAELSAAAFRGDALGVADDHRVPIGRNGPTFSPARYTNVANDTQRDARPRPLSSAVALRRWPLTIPKQLWIGALGFG